MMVKPASLPYRRTRDYGSRGWGFESSWAHNDLNDLAEGRPMILGISIATYTLIHVGLSLVGIVAGLVVAGGLATGTRLDRWAAVFLVTTGLANAGGFGVRFVQVLSSVVCGLTDRVV